MIVIALRWSNRMTDWNEQQKKKRRKKNYDSSNNNNIMIMLMAHGIHEYIASSLSDLLYYICIHFHVVSSNFLLHHIQNRVHFTFYKYIIIMILVRWSECNSFGDNIFTTNSSYFLANASTSQNHGKRWYGTRPNNITTVTWTSTTTTYLLYMHVSMYIVGFFEQKYERWNWFWGIVRNFGNIYQMKWE